MAHSIIHNSSGLAELALSAQPLPAPLGTEGVALLDPETLSRTAEAAARALLRQGEAKNTQTSYRSALRYWCAWYALRYGAALALPLPVPVVIQFIVDHAARRAESGDDEPTTEGTATERPAPLITELPPALDAALVRQGYKAKLGPPALNTLLHRLSVMAKAHQLLREGPGKAGSAEHLGAPSSLGNPCADPAVRELLARTRRAYVQRGERMKRQPALTKEPLQRLLATCDDSAQGRRDRALLLFAWASGGRRRSEVAHARLEHLHRVDEQGFLYHLAHSKTNQVGASRPEDTKPLVGPAGQAMQAWLQVLHAQGIAGAGAIFRRIRRGGHVGEALAPAAVRDIVKARCVLAGVPDIFSAHSLRAGFVTEAGKQDVPLAETMALTGHRSVATVLGYFRAENSLSSKASRMLDDE